MNDPSKWRLDLARKIAIPALQNPKLAAIVICGSVVRGCADCYSDIDISVFWHEPPFEQDRTGWVEKAG